MQKAGCLSMAIVSNVAGAEQQKRTSGGKGVWQQPDCPSPWVNPAVCANRLFTQGSLLPASTFAFML
jgi:hypothetical protein